jgi:hypothetical protein
VKEILEALKRFMIEFQRVPIEGTGKVNVQAAFIIEAIEEYIKQHEKLKDTLWGKK